MHKIISWFIVMFIGLVPLGAFFNTKQPPKPNMEQFFMKRQKRATNPTQCGDSCELQFSSLLNITLVLDSGVYFDLSKFDIELPNDVKNQNKNYPNRLPFFMDSQTFLPIKDFFQKYGTFQSIGSKKIYTIPKVVDIVIKLRNLSPYSLIFFSAEMPNKN
ncbi:MULTISPECIES: hypothetical protein [unclassified Spiroplasma]|uniref:hypothetical protein n=1 Tax=unclassified Spiroplasma TaxID=2637901 RepID=UPI00313BB0D2